MDEAAAHRGSRWITSGLAVILLCYLAHTYYFRHYVNDDAYITYRYSSFLAQGRGPYFNEGEHVEGYTNFLLMLLLVPVIALGGEGAAPIAAKAIGVAAGFAVVFAAYRLAAALEGRRADGHSVPGTCAVAAAGIVAVSPAFALNAMSGLETTLFGAAITVGLATAAGDRHARRAYGAGLAFAIAVLTRPEGILIFALYWCTQVLLCKGLDRTLTDGDAGQQDQRLPYQRSRHYWVRVGVLVAVVMVAHTVFRLIAYDGDLLPNTYYAKKGGFWEVDAFQYVNDGILMPCLGVVGATLGALGWVAARAQRRPAVPVAVVAGAGALLPFVTGTDWMPGWRMVMPYLPAAAGLTAVGWCRIAGLLLERRRWAAQVLVLCTLPLLWFVQAKPRANFHGYTMLRARGYARGHMALGDWLANEAAEQGDTVALMDIGIIGYRCTNLRVLDISGLTDRLIARSQGTFLDKEFDVDYVMFQYPEFIILVMAGEPNGDKSPDAELSLTPWTRVERSIWEHPEFQRHYVKRQRLPFDPPTTTTGIAGRLGAVRVFQHDYPGRYYLLAVFHRHESTTD
ncbi:MAG: hypothetical protein ACE5HE_04890 [Phycisphaerae bacterium]